jgi:sugar phosphate isomerase/epimerase
MIDPIPAHEPFSTRRHLLKAAGAATLGAAFANAASGGQTFLSVATTAPKTPPAGTSQQKDAPLMQIGILLGTYGRPTLEARLDAAKTHGLACVQMSMDCAGQPAMPDKIAPELADRIRREAAARGITIASLHGTFNMTHPDAEQRRAGLRRLRVLALACERMGTSKIHICTGTRDPGNLWRRHPDNDSPAAWRDMAACVREATDIAKQAGVVLAFEPEVNNVVDSAKKARRLLDEIGSPHLKVCMDGANIFHAGELVRMSEILDEAIALLGKDIVLAHAKDLDHDGDAGHLAAGRGRLDYDRYLRLLGTNGFHGPLLLHGLSESQVPSCVAFLREKLARVAAARAKA